MKQYLGELQGPNECLTQTTYIGVEQSPGFVLCPQTWTSLAHLRSIADKHKTLSQTSAGTLHIVPVLAEAFDVANGKLAEMMHAASEWESALTLTVSVAPDDVVSPQYRSWNSKAPPM